MSVFPPPPDSWMETPPRPGSPDLIPGLLKRHGHLLLAGEHEVGKTLITLEICHAVITGQPLWGQIIPTQTVAAVTYIMGEHDEDQVREQWRLTGLVFPPKTLRLIGTPHRKLLISKGGILLQGHRDVYQHWCEGSGLIVFDPLSAFVAGADAENDAIQMRALINAMNDIAYLNGAALILVHHMGKPHYDPKSGGYTQRERYASRGSSGIEDAVMCCYYVRHSGKTLYQLKRAKFKGQAPSFYHLKRDRTTLRHTLIRKGLTPAEYAASMQRET